MKRTAPQTLTPSKKPSLLKSLVWFRLDLRTLDNPALFNAPAPSIAVFFIAPQMWKRHGQGALKTDHILRTVKLLKEKLEELRIPLIDRKLGDERNLNRAKEEIVKMPGRKHMPGFRKQRI